MAKRVIILGAAGRDYHNFNVYFRDNPEYNVVCFTAAQIPDIAGRKYPKELAGKLYPKGIPVYEEKKLPELIKKFKADEVVLAYSDLSHKEVMQKASLVMANGADFKLMGTKSTMLKSKKKVVSVCAVRTGSGKSQATRAVASILKKRGKKIVIVRHPMPYGDLRKQAWERFETYHDLDYYKCTIEEREEYENEILEGDIVYAGVDYTEILKRAEKEAEIIIWDGGNNDFPFFMTDFHIVIADALRAGDELTYYPGETNLRMADAVVINKVNTAKGKDVKRVEDDIKLINPKAKIIRAKSEVFIESPKEIKNRRALIIEDGPTLTHGGMSFGAATVAARKYKARIVDGKKYAVGEIKKLYSKYKHLDKAIPAVGYSGKQTDDLKRTINKADCDFVLSGTPMDLSKIIKVNKPIVRVSYDLDEGSKKKIGALLKKF